MQKKLLKKRTVISLKRPRSCVKKGLAAAANKSGRIATEGIVESYIHAGGRIGVLVEINCETDFVGKTDQFRDFARDVAMQIAAATRFMSAVKTFLRKHSTKNAKS